MDAQQSSEPILDLAIAAQHADAELRSITSQLASFATVTEPKAMMVSADDKDDESDSDSSGDDKVINLIVSQPVKKNTTGESSGDGSDEEVEEPIQLGAKINANMKKENDKAGGPLTTEHEVVLAPVREPEVELTVDCPITKCGSILNVSVPGLMMTVKSNPNTKPLDEGSLLCLEDRTVLGCVDEVFGPVLMPMYLIRFKDSIKIPKTAIVNASVYSATEHTTYIIPENIKDKGTDASDIFDEETDETEFSDDEAEAAAKRGNRKRIRGGAPRAGSKSAPSAFVNGGGGSCGGRGGLERNFTDSHFRMDTLPHESRVPSRQPPMPTIPAMQTQPFGGVTKYTQPGGFGMLRPMVYGSTKYTSPQDHGGLQRSVLQYNGVSVSQGHISAHGYYQPPLPMQHSTPELPSCNPQFMRQQYLHSLRSPYGQLQSPPYQHQPPSTVPYSQPQPLLYIPAPPLPPANYANGQHQQGQQQ